MGAGRVAKFFQYYHESGLWLAGKETTERSMITFFIFDQGNKRT